MKRVLQAFLSGVLSFAVTVFLGVGIELLSGLLYGRTTSGFMFFVFTLLGLFIALATVVAVMDETAK